MYEKKEKKIPQKNIKKKKISGSTLKFFVSISAKFGTLVEAKYAYSSVPSAYFTVNNCPFK